MQNPSTPEELAAAIESLVSVYMDQVRTVAQGAVERSLSGSRTHRDRLKPAPRRRSAPSTPSKRRTAAEVDDLCAELCKLVRARPGESLAVLAEEMSVPASTLKRPMNQLRSQGRVRTVGQRHLTRYFPTVNRGDVDTP